MNRLAIALLACGALSACDLTLGIDDLTYDRQPTGGGGSGGATTNTGGNTTTNSGGGGTGGGVGGMGAGGAAAGGAAAGGGVTTYVDEVLADTPLAYWRLGEASGAVAADASGNGFAASYIGTVGYGTAGAIVGDADTAIQLDGTSGWLTHAHTFDDFVGNEPYTFECWIKPDTYDTTYRHPYHKEIFDGGGRQNMGIYLQSTETLGNERYVDNAKSVIHGPLPPLGQWAHIVATYDGSALGLYINGALVGTSPDPAAAATKPSPSFMGAKDVDNGVMIGALDEFAIYDYALTQARVTAHYVAGIGN